MSSDELETMRVVIGVLDSITTTGLAVGGGMFLWRAMRESERQHVETLRQWIEACERNRDSA